MAEKMGPGGAGTYYWGKFGEGERTERLKPDGQENAQSLWPRHPLVHPGSQCSASCLLPAHQDNYPSF